MHNLSAARSFQADHFSAAVPFAVRGSANGQRTLLRRRRFGVSSAWNSVKFMRELEDVGHEPIALSGSRRCAS